MTNKELKKEILLSVIGDCKNIIMNPTDENLLEMAEYYDFKPDYTDGSFCNVESFANKAFSILINNVVDSIYDEFEKRNQY